MNKETSDFIEFVESVKNDFLVQNQVAFDANAPDSLHEFYDSIVDFLKDIIATTAIINPQLNYLNQLRNDVTGLQGNMPYRFQPNNAFVFGNERGIASHLESLKTPLEEGLKNLIFKFNFFRTLSFFSSNVAIIGANGSGKTSVSYKLKDLMATTGVVISAQRILLVPTFNSIHNPDHTLSDLRLVQNADKTNKDINLFQNLHTEFEKVLKHLLAENIAIGNKYKIDAIKLADNNEEIPKPKESNLDKTLKIWNSLIVHRKLDCADGINILVILENGNSYPITKMSDGEKVMLFLIAQILQAPEYGFIIVDEPEMYLHKTILKKLWDTLEKERQDCIFIYLTHDLDFAASRVTAKKIWIKSFTYPDKWEMEVIPENDLPESLLLELLGSRKNIMFCEGKKGKLDEKIFNILFPNYTICPVGGCFEVINHTKAFNRLQNVNIDAIGIIDSDHHPVERLSKLKDSSIYHFKVAEVENLLLDEQFLRVLASEIMVNPDEVENIKKDVIDELNKTKTQQASNFVSSRIDYYFKDSNIKKGNTLVELETNFSVFTSEIKIKELFEERLAELANIVSSKEYAQTISVLNNKGAKMFVEKYFKISDFSDRAIKLLEFNAATHDMILKYFPENLR